MVRPRAPALPAAGVCWRRAPADPGLAASSAAASAPFGSRRTGEVMNASVAGVVIRPDLRYAWYGPALLVTNTRGECGGDQTLSGFFFRETRFLRELRLEIDGQRPWLCASGAAEQRTLA